MRNILAAGNREVLRQFARSNVLLAFDFDGTLAPIVAHPDRASMRTRTRARLAKLTELYPVVVISGRAQSDARQRLKGVGLRAVLGNHGIEPWQATGPAEGRVHRWRSRLAGQLAHLRGVRIEDKRFSLSIHYRQSRAKKSAREAILAAVSGTEGLRVIGGKQVVNVLPGSAPHKGLALDRERERLRCDTAIYVGDDETDEDVFALDQPGRLLAIRVGARRQSQAAYCLRGQAQVDELLQFLIELRRSRTRRPRRPS